MAELNQEPSTGVIEVDMFGAEVDGPDHQEALAFRGILEEVADEYGCRLTYFSVSGGTVSFAFDSDLLMADIIRILQFGR